MRAVRLDRLLANLGYGSRREIHGLLDDGRVRLDGAILRRPDAAAPLTRDLAVRLSVGGAPLDPIGPLVVILHKPAGLVCSHREPGRSVYDLFPERWRRRRPRLVSVGRLDADTTGLLLITDDGQFAHRVSAPRAGLSKRYLAALARPLTGAEQALFASGQLVLQGESTPLASADLRALSPTTVHLTLTEGRYHQVKRMFAAVGNHVERLHRDRIGALDMPTDLDPGEFRLMSDRERETMIGGAQPSLGCPPHST